MLEKIKEMGGMVCVQHRQCWNKGEKVSEGWHVLDPIQAVKADSNSSVDDALEKLVKARKKRAAEPADFPNIGYELDLFFSKLHWVLRSAQDDHGSLDHLEVMDNVCRQFKKDMLEYYHLEGKEWD